MIRLSIRRVTMKEPYLHSTDLSSEAGPGKSLFKLLVHICCGPCSVYPLKALLAGRAEVSGFFHNPNIHPYSEFKKRLEAAKTLARHLAIDVVFDERYMPVGFINGVRGKGASRSWQVGLEAGPSTAQERFPQKNQRCAYCYSSRLEATARAAREGGFDAFTSTLLYSTSQGHDVIKTLGVDLAEKYGILFYYEDFRTGWQQGLDETRALGLYRQRYCGCIYSRIERGPVKKKG